MMTLCASGIVRRHVFFLAGAALVAAGPLGCGGNNGGNGGGGGGGGAGPGSTSSAGPGSTSSAGPGSTSSSTGMATACMPGATEACYSGPPGTKGVGACVSGTHTCADDGSGFGACIGEVLPAAPQCYGGADRDCDGKIDGSDPSVKQCGAALWGLAAGDGVSGYGQQGKRVAADAAGNVVVAGEFYGSIDFGAGPLQEAGKGDIFVARFDPTGKLLWAKAFGGAGAESLDDMVVDPAGDVFLSGTFSGTVDFGAGPLDASKGIAFLLKLSAAGDVAFSKGFTSEGAALALDGAGHVLMGGLLDPGGADFGEGTLPSAGKSVFFATFDAAGKYLSGQAYPTTGDYQVRFKGIAVDGAGDVILGGIYDDGLDIGGNTLEASNNGAHPDIFIAKIDAAGNPVWAQSFITSGPNSADFDLRTDSQGNVIVSGECWGAIDFGLGPLSVSGSASAFVAKLDPTGKALWSKAYSAGGVDAFRRTAVDANDEIVVAGSFDSTGFDLGSGQLPQVSNAPVVAKFDPTGKLLWAFSIPSHYDAYAQGVAVDPSGHVLVTGRTKGGWDYGSGFIGYSNQRRMFLVARSP